MRESTIENHPQRAVIIEGLAKKIPFRKLAASVTPPVTANAVQRFAKKQLQRSQPFGRTATDSTSFTSKQWCEREYVTIYEAATRNKRKDLPSARAALDSICRLNGYDAPRRTESAVLNVHALAPGALAGQLAAMLQALPEHERRALAASEPAIAAECIDTTATGE